MTTWHGGWEKNKQCFSMQGFGARPGSVHRQHGPCSRSNAGHSQHEGFRTRPRADPGGLVGSVTRWASRGQSRFPVLPGGGKVGWVKPQATTHRIAVAFLTRKQDNITSFPHRLAVVGDDLDRLEPRLGQFWLDGLAVADNEDEAVGGGDDFGHGLLDLGERDAFSRLGRNVSR